MRKRTSVVFTVLVLAALITMTSVCFAGTEDEVEGWSKSDFKASGSTVSLSGSTWAKGVALFSDITRAIATISVSGAVLVGTISAFVWFTSTEQKMVDLAASWGKRVVFALLATGCLNIVLNTIGKYVTK